VRVALIAPPYIPVPPIKYGGTELFLAHLAAGLRNEGIDAVVYANGESRPEAELRSLYAKAEWPLPTELDIYKELNQCSWAVRDAIGECDVIHLNSALGLPLAEFSDKPFVYTVHHALDERLKKFYRFYPRVHYVTISDAQREQQQLPNSRTIHHGISLTRYTLVERKQEYLSFLGRIAPVKGVKAAIEIAKKCEIPLKIAGEVQPLYRDYFENVIHPLIDGRFIEYVGEADLAVKNELLGNSRAMLFPIQWDEPFGLVMIEAMACGTPVLALRRGSVPEVVKDGVSGYVCADTAEMAERACTLELPAAQVRAYVAERFAVERMVRQYAQLYRQVAATHAKSKPTTGKMTA